jgi:hypothetical protein
MASVRAGDGMQVFQCVCQKVWFYAGEIYRGKHGASLKLDGLE